MNNEIYIVTITDRVCRVGDLPREKKLYFTSERAATLFLEGFQAAETNLKEISMRTETFYDGR